VYKSRGMYVKCTKIIFSMPAIVEKRILIHMLITGSLKLLAREIITRETA
jgi:hypothetical protein